MRSKRRIALIGGGICLIIIAIVSVILIGRYIRSNYYGPTPKDYTIIDGFSLKQDNTIISENITVYKAPNSTYAVLPFVKTISALGAEVTWQNETTAEILCNGKLYTLDLDNASLIAQDDQGDLNLFAINGGGKRTAVVQEKEIMLDSPTINSAWIKMCTKRLDLQFDYENKIIVLTDVAYTG